MNSRLVIDPCDSKGLQCQRALKALIGIIAVFPAVSNAAYDAAAVEHFGEFATSEFSEGAAMTKRSPLDNPILAESPKDSPSVRSLEAQDESYDAADDFARSLDACYAAIRARVAAGGEGWEP